MAFQPFGYRFEVSSRLTPAEAKAAIRSKKTRIFDSKNGARGWIIGPVFCLWFSAFDQHGPMLFGLITADSSGTRAHGRAGSNLNGVAMFTLISLSTAWLFLKLAAEDRIPKAQLLVIACIYLLMGVTICWTSHIVRKDAEPLVRFLRKTLTSETDRSRSTPIHLKNDRELRLILNGDYIDGPATVDRIDSTLMRVGKQGFLIIEEDTENYLQTMLRDEGYILEIRRGGAYQHYQAVRNGSAVTDVAPADDLFSFEQVSDIIASYVSGGPVPNFMRLQPIDVSQ